MYKLTNIYFICKNDELVAKEDHKHIYSYSITKQAWLIKIVTTSLPLALAMVPGNTSIALGLQISVLLTLAFDFNLLH